MKQKTRGPLKAEEVKQFVCHIFEALASIDFDEFSEFVRRSVPSRPGYPVIIADPFADLGSYGLGGRRTPTVSQWAASDARLG